MNKTVSIAYAAFQSLQAVATIDVTVVGADGATQRQTVAPGTNSVSFDVAVGSYTASAQAVDANGAPVGPAASVAFVVDAPATITVQIPAALVVD